ncbi:MAG TPA: hypothetical protein VNT55_11375 [Baekduia sp.]|nr:hypothetical protein [Baekduia sp.]
MRTRIRRAAAIAGLALTACFAVAGSASAAATFHYTSETTAPSADVTTAEVTVFPADTVADQALQVLDATGTTELYRSPSAKHGASLTWTGVPVAVGQVVRLLDGGGLPVAGASDTFHGPLLAADACAGATAFSGRSTVLPRYSLNHAGPYDVARFDAGTFGQTLPAPLKAGDVVAVSADWTNADGSTGGSAQILTVTASCPPPPPPPAPPAPPPAPESPVGLGGSAMRVTALLGPAANNYLDGAAAGRLIWSRGTESPFGTWAFSVGGRASVAATENGQAVSVVATPSVGPNDTFDLHWTWPGVGAHELRRFPVLGPTIFFGGCAGSTSVIGGAPRAFGADAAVTATLNGASVPVTTDAEQFRVALPAPLKDGDRLVLKVSHTWPPLHTTGIVLPAIEYQGIYTLTPGPGTPRVGCATTITAAVGAGVTTVVGTLGGIISGTFVSNILTNGGLTVTLPSPGPGSFNLGLLFDNSGGGGARASASRPKARRSVVTVASAKAKATRGGQRLRVRLKLTKAGRRILRSARTSLRLRAQVTFDPATRGLPTVTKSKTTMLKVHRPKAKPRG